MARKNAKHSYMTRTEVIGGLIFFAVYLLVMPLLLQKIYTLIGVLLDVHISSALANVVYYYILFAVTVVLFTRFLGETTSRFFGELNRCLTTAGMALVLFYGANELFYRLCSRLYMSVTNLNDVTIAAQIDDAPRTTAFIIIFLAPFVEEVLFRGLIFGCLAEKSVPAAYAVSALLFAFAHVWQFLIGGMGLGYLVVMLQYLIPGLVFAWAYGRSGSVWTSILVHALVNALAFWALA
ncbi:MAG: lysostaphin resistance A-like protein [Oscillospiraceae bacterium]